MTHRTGTAGWTIPRNVADQFPNEGSALERYASRFAAAEINSSFHRPHRVSTWERWRDSVPRDFRFSVKLPKTITHVAKLGDCGDLVDEFLQSAHLLRANLGVLLVQLPPKLEFDVAVAEPFFANLKRKSPASLACEPRNASWFTSEAEALLNECEVARVAADPSISDEAALPGGWPGMRYWRLHGSPQMYRSSYADRIDRFAKLIRDHSAGAADSWCIFDNTASSASAGDALALQSALGAST